MKEIKIIVDGANLRYFIDGNELSNVQEFTFVADGESTPSLLIRQDVINTEK